ncbi:MAG TPA: hypothetical protein VFG05_00075 [Methylocella sp.]|nr:hypothetical protein [Methylocella sp.]
MGLPIDLQPLIAKAAQAHRQDEVSLRRAISQSALLAIYRNNIEALGES